MRVEAAAADEEASQPALVDVVVPVYNEADSIEELYRRVHHLNVAATIIFVDNASTDDSVARIKRLPGVRLVRHEHNLGYGASIRDGLASARADKVVILDADLEYPPEAIPDMVRALDQHAAVYGSRFLAARKPDMAPLRRFGNRLISAVFNRLYGQRTTDFYTGMKGLRRDAFSRLALEREGFEHVVELGAQLTRLGFKIHEVPVEYSPRSRGVSKMRHLPETLKYVWFVARYWFIYMVLDRPIGLRG